jgi:hypothetical protein
MRRAHAAAAWLAISVLSGCQEQPQRDDSIPLEKVPAAALAAAKKALPGVRLKTAWKAKDQSGGEFYEIRGHSRESGRTRDVRVTPEGRVLEVD